MSAGLTTGRFESETRGQVCALVTGGGVRIGRSIALALASRGHLVAVHYHGSAEGAAETVEEIRRRGGEARLFPADLGDPGACRRLARETVESYGPIGVLVNSAAVFFDNDPERSVEDSWHRQSAINVLAPHILSVALAEGLSLPRQGSIINVLDARLNRPAGDHLLYRLTKAALAHLTQCQAQEFAPRIRVNGIAPGALLPPTGESEAELRARLETEVPLGLPKNRSIARTIHYLLDEPFVTGQIINLDGGQYS